jgi:hypothetical protein
VAIRGIAFDIICGRRGWTLIFRSSVYAPHRLPNLLSDLLVEILMTFGNSCLWIWALIDVLNSEDAIGIWLKLLYFWRSNRHSGLLRQLIKSSFENGLSYWCFWKAFEVVIGRAQIFKLQFLHWRWEIHAICYSFGMRWVTSWVHVPMWMSWNSVDVLWLDEALSLIYWLNANMRSVNLNGLYSILLYFMIFWPKLKWHRSKMWKVAKLIWNFWSRSIWPYLYWSF